MVNCKPFSKTVSKMPVPTSSINIIGPQTQPLMVSKKALRLSKSNCMGFLLCLFYFLKHHFFVVSCNFSTECLRLQHIYFQKLFVFLP